jgi:hypothetical protein
MKIMFRITLAFALSVACAAFASADTSHKSDYRDADVIISAHLPHIEFVSYAGIGGGAIFAEGSAAPLFETSAGLQFTPWLALGGFWSVAPLSDFDHGRLGVSISDVEASYAIMSGTEILITPFAAKVVHPLFRVALGGVTVGHLENIDEKEGYDTATDDRFFLASVAAGAEFNLSRHLRLALRGGWRVAANEEMLGIEEGGLSGPEIALTLRALWRTVID